MAAGTTANQNFSGSDVEDGVVIELLDGGDSLQTVKSAGNLSRPRTFGLLHEPQPVAADDWRR